MPRRSSHSVVAWVGLCAALTASGSPDAVVAQAARTRTVFYDTFPIAAKLRPDDEVVIVQMRADESVTDKVSSGFDALRVAARSRTAIVATVDVSEVRSELALDGAWVHTVFRGTVARVHRMGPDVERRHRIQSGEHIEFHVSGGQVNINHVVVKAVPVVPFPRLVSTSCFCPASKSSTAGA